jgi:hypothetical protein
MSQLISVGGCDEMRSSPDDVAVGGLLANEAAVS